jgi:hypothetical protein
VYGGVERGKKKEEEVWELLGWWLLVMNNYGYCLKASGIVTYLIVVGVGLKRMRICMHARLVDIY